MKNKKENRYRKAGVGLGIFAIFVLVLLVVANTGNVIVDDGVDVEIRTGSHKDVFLPFLGTNDPGAGLSGVLNVFVNATNTSVAPYTSNLTGAYETGDVNNSHIGSDVPYAVGFDVIVQVRFNKSHAYDSAWNLSLVRAYANSTVLGVTAIQMVEAQITDSADYLYVSYFLRDNDGGAGTGFVIGSGVNVTGFAVNFESFYYG